jgi:hypothetical protein
MVVALLLQVQVREEPKDWKLIITEHFNLYYPSDDLLTRAREFAAWFEQARADHVAAMGVEPSRIYVFLFRSVHDLNQASILGAPSSRPLSRRIRGPAQIREFEEDRHERSICRPILRSRGWAFAEPQRNRIFIPCQASDRWNRWFVRHELAHQFQFERVFPFRLPSWMLVLKDPLLPAWWVEGGADYWAGMFDSRIDQYVRDLADEHLYDLKELFSQDTLNSYDRMAVYYEGSYYWRFLDEAYGAGSGRKLFDRTARMLPLASQKPLQQVTGKDRADFERDFAANLRARWAPMMAGRSAPTDRLTDTRAYYRRRSSGGRWSPDGKHLAWVGDADLVPELYVDGKGMLGWTRSLDGSWIASIPSWSPDGKRLVVVLERTHRDLLLLADLEGGTEFIELPFDEIYDPAWSPDGRKIAFSALKAGTSDLYVLHLADRRIERITDDPAADSQPAWSADGRLAWIKEIDGHTVLMVEGKPVTTSWALLESPQWSPDGKSIVLAADVGGVWDAFSVDPRTGRAKRLTKFKGGLSFPAWHPTDGTLVITYFEGRGTDLYRVKPEPQEEPDFEQETRKPWYDQFKKSDPAGERADKTRVYGINWLQFPVTSYSLLLPGAELQAGDRDGETLLSLQAYFQPSRDWEVTTTIANTRWRPTIGASAEVGRSGDLLSMSATPFVDVPILETLEAGLGWTLRERTEYFNPPPNVRVFDSGPAMSARYTNQHGLHPYDSSWGFSFGGSASIFREEFGGDRDLREYFAFAETSTAIIDQDLILWTRSTFERLVGRVFLDDEILRMRSFVRGARALEGLESVSGTIEVRFPIHRDLMWKPLEIVGLGEWLMLKDLRAFVFGDVGWLTRDIVDPRHNDSWAYSAGVGLRLDLSAMIWPVIVNRTPIRLEGWCAFVGQPFESNRIALGVGLTFGY